MLHRAVCVALMHPLNKKGRDKIIRNKSSFLIDFDSAYLEPYLNKVRLSFQSLLKSGDRLSYLAVSLWCNVEAIVNKFTSDDTNPDESNDNHSIALKPQSSITSYLYLAQGKALYDWQYDDKSNYSFNIDLSQFDTKSRSGTVVSASPGSFYDSSSPLKSSYLNSPPSSRSILGEDSKVNPLREMQFTSENVSPISSRKSILSETIDQVNQFICSSVEELVKIDDLLMIQSYDQQPSNTSHSIAKDMFDTYIIDISSLILLEKSYHRVKDRLMPTGDCILNILSRGLCNHPLTTLQVCHH